MEIPPNPWTRLGSALIAPPELARPPHASLCKPVRPLLRATTTRMLPRAQNPLAEAHANGQFEASLKRRLKALRMRWLCYGKLEESGSRLQVLPLLTVLAPQPWLQIYLQETYAEVDPRMRAWERCRLPLAWDLNSLSQFAPPGMERKFDEFVRGLAAAGIASGLFVCVGGQPEGPSFLSLLSPHPGLPQLSETELGLTLALATSLHDLFSMQRASAADDSMSAAGLSFVQMEMLRHVSEGLSDKAIAARLHCSVYNVDYHLRRLRQRFQVSNRLLLAKKAQALLGAPIQISSPRLAGTGVPVATPRPASSTPVNELVSC